MKFGQFIRKYLLGESVKEVELNRILDKVSKKEELIDREKRFLNLYHSTTEDDIKDFLYLSKNSTYQRIKNILSKGFTIICNLTDRNGKIGMKIQDIENDFENEVCIVYLKNGDKCKLHDRFLYNIVYNAKKDEYSLEAQDEYYEKIPINNED